MWYYPKKTLIKFKNLIRIGDKLTDETFLISILPVEKEEYTVMLNKLISLEKGMKTITDAIKYDIKEEYGKEIDSWKPDLEDKEETESYINITSVLNTKINKNKHYKEYSNEYETLVKEYVQIKEKTFIEFKNWFVKNIKEITDNDIKSLTFNREIVEYKPDKDSIDIIKNHLDDEYNKEIEIRLDGENTFWCDLLKDFGLEKIENGKKLKVLDMHSSEISPIDILFRYGRNEIGYNYFLEKLKNYDEFEILSSKEMEELISDITNNQKIKGS